MVMNYSVKQILDKFNTITNKKIKYKIGKRRSSDIVVSIANPNNLKRLLAGNQNLII